MTAHTNSISTEQSSTVPRITIETALWGGIALTALAIRVAGLTHFPLNEAEAAQSLAALSVYHGEIPAGNYSPLLTTLMSGAFVLFSATDWAARLVNVLLGVALVLLPLGLRRELGRGGALISALLLAVSPAPLFWSRTISGDMPAAVGAMLVAVGAARWLADNRAGGLYAIAGGLAMLLTGAPVGFSALAALGLLLVAVWFSNKSIGQSITQKLADFGPDARQASWFGLGLLLALATAITFNLSGLAAVSTNLTEWLGQFGLTVQSGSALPAIILIGLYNPLLVVFGLAGAAMAVQRRNWFNWLALVWAVVAASMDAMMGGRTGGQVLLVAVPLTLLAAQAINALVEDWRAHVEADRDGLLAAIGLVVSVFVYISLMTWSKCAPAQAGCETAWILPVSGITLIVGLAVVFGAWYGPAIARRGLGVIALATATVLTLGLSVRLAFGPLDALPFQPMLQLPASNRLPNLTHDLDRLSMARAGDLRELDVAVVDADVPQLRWLLRDFPRARFVPDFSAAQGATVILARPDTGAPLGAYIGQDYTLISFWQIQLLQGKDWLRWYMLRSLPAHRPGSDQLVLWLKQDGEISY